MLPQQSKAFDNHQQFSFVFDEKSGLTAFVAIHRGGVTNPAFGATRFWRYQNLSEAIEDSLKLSKTMSYKSALAGLRYGGAKAVIVDSGQNAKAKLRAYAQNLKRFSSSFVTGADLGIGPSELKIIASGNRNVVGLHSDPVKFTTLGVFYSIKTTLNFLYGSDSLLGRQFAIQGLGKTGLGLLERLYPEAKKIFVYDINPHTLNHVKRVFPKVASVTRDEIYKQEVDIFSPCAVSNSLNSKSVNFLKCKAVVGSANSQLESVEVGQKLFQKGILYAPDYLVNAGGLIAVVDEYDHDQPDDSRVEDKVDNIKLTLKRVLDTGKRLHKPPSEVADDLAKKLLPQFN